MTYPAAKTNLNNPLPGDDTATPASGAQKHSDQHGLINDTVEELQDKVGYDASTPSEGKALMGTASAGHSTWRAPTVADLTEMATLLSGISVGDMIQWDGTKFVKATVPILTDLVWEGDSVPTGGFISP